MIEQFINAQQLDLLNMLSRTSEESGHFKSLLKEMTTLIENMPATYAQESKGENAVVHLHYFTGDMDAWITEKDKEEQQLQAFGLIDLGQGKELGYISISDLIENGFELDLYWDKKTLKEIK